MDSEKKCASKTCGASAKNNNMWCQDHEGSCPYSVSRGGKKQMCMIRNCPKHKNNFCLCGCGETTEKVSRYDTKPFQCGRKWYICKTEECKEQFFRKMKGYCAICAEELEKKREREERERRKREREEREREEKKREEKKREEKERERICFSCGLIFYLTFKDMTYENCVRCRSIKICSIEGCGENVYDLLGERKIKLCFRHRNKCTSIGCMNHRPGVCDHKNCLELYDEVHYTVYEHEYVPYVCVKHGPSPPGGPC